MQAETNPAFLPHLSQRFISLIWTCLDADLHKSALFYAERYWALDPSNHDARHLYATTMLRSGQPHSALHIAISDKGSRPCSGCLEIASKAQSVLGRHRLSREALEEGMKDKSYTPTGAYIPSLLFSGL